MAVREGECGREGVCVGVGVSVGRRGWEGGWENTSCSSLFPSLLHIYPHTSPPSSHMYTLSHLHTLTSLPLPHVHTYTSASLDAIAQDIASQPSPLDNHSSPFSMVDSSGPYSVETRSPGYMLQVLPSS